MHTNDRPALTHKRCHQRAYVSGVGSSVPRPQLYGSACMVLSGGAAWEQNWHVEYAGRGDDKSTAGSILSIYCYLQPQGRRVRRPAHWLSTRPMAWPTGIFRAHGMHAAAVRKRTKERSRKRHGTSSAGRARTGHAAYEAGQQAATAAKTARYSHGSAVISGWRLSQ